MSEWNVVISKPADSPLAIALAETHGLNVLAVPDVYDLPEVHIATAAINDLEGPVAVAADYQPRAIYWTLAAKGLTGRRADLADLAEAKAEGRPIHPINLIGCDDDAAEAKILAVTGKGSAGAVRDLREEVVERWYPVIDFDRCVHCYECVEFCLFGVYELTVDEKVVAAIPDNCKPGCPACSRVCPTAGIIFTRFHDGGPIAGADEGRPEQFKGDAARQASSGDVKTYESAREDAEKPGGDRIDQLIDGLESFES